MKEAKISTVIVCCIIMAACGIFGGSKNISIASWSSHQKANFFMTTWQSEKRAYDQMNALPNKPEDLIKVLESKYKILENSRVPIRTYITIVNNGGTPDISVEQQIIDWIRELQIQYVYSAAK